MTISRKIAFFAPIKPPDHPIPSGDRLIAQNLIKAFELGGNAVELASRYICYSKRSGLDILEQRKSGALIEADRLIEQYFAQDLSDRPEIWITYHPYCKAPDWIGPIVTKALDIPYVTIEAARTGQGGPDDEWAPWRAEAQAGIRQADMHLVFKPTDRAYLSELLGSAKNLRDFPTFVDLETLIGEGTHVLPSHWSKNTPVCVTAGMMRKGKKDKNFYILADFFSDISDHDWNLVIVGGGPEEDAIRSAFAAVPPERIHWTGQLEHSEVLKWMRSADVFIWPGWKEPIGMVYLEAQAQRLPVIAYESMGVPLVVDHGITGLLAAEGDIAAMKSNILTLFSDSDLRNTMGEAGQQKVEDTHSLQAASDRLNLLLAEYG